MSQREQTGLVLEGGAVRGIFTAGVLDYLMERDCYLPYVAGVSAGACNAVDYASRQIGRTKECMIPGLRGESYITLKGLVKNRSLFDMDMLFDQYPNETLPFDFDTYFRSPIQCELVVTNCLTGKAEYLNERSGRDRLMKIVRASSSIPMVSPMVFVDGIPYLDGGVADPIPIIRSLKTGHRKNVIVLTRNQGHRKKPPGKSRAIYHQAFRKYPKLYEAILRRTYLYNKTISYIEKWEQEGKVFVLRPTLPEVSRTEKDPKVLEAFYQNGYQSMKERFGALEAYLQEDFPKKEEIHRVKEPSLENE